MKRIKRHKIKTEQPESSSHSREHEEHDLAYYIHDRVELMHQVFSMIKYKDLKAMAPECVRNLPVGDLQELCTEELLGISSKRLLATLDGAEPPSDTESSSGSPTPDPMETISLDSISSDEEILSQSSKKKKHKHRRSSKSKSKKREKQKPQEAADDTMEVSKASRAGLTVLELLELQARARAIRAQLQNEHTKKQAVAVVADSNTDDEVEIKEEEPDVVEISSGDEKPDLTALQQAAQKTPKPKEPQKQTETPKSKEPSKLKETSKTKEPQPKEPEITKEKENPEKTTVTRRISDLIITVPQAKATRKIKLNRTKVTVTVPNATDKTVETRIVTTGQSPEDKVTAKDDKSKKKQKKKKKKSLDKEGSDHDEITLQLSDSEKMDLLEDLNERNYDRLSSSSSDSESSSSDSEADVTNTSKSNLTDAKVETEDLNKSNKVQTETDSNKTDNVDDNAQSSVKEKSNTKTIADTTSIETTHEAQNLENVSNENVIEKNVIESKPTSTDNAIVSQNQIDDGDESHVIVESLDDKKDALTVNDKVDSNDIATVPEIEEDAENDITEEPPLKEVEPEIVETTAINDAPVSSIETAVSTEETPVSTEKIPVNSDETPVSVEETPVTVEETTNEQLTTNANQDTESESNKEKERRDISEGELSDRESSEVEAVDIEPEVVCISDDEKQKNSKKKKKKDKKAKKEKKSKKSKQDFREGDDQNFYKDADQVEAGATNEAIADSTTIDVTDDDVYEILELSDDSSCYEVEGTVLSKEPTAEEIEALSARIDEINKDDESTEPNDCEPANADEESEPETHMSWKDRYLDSKKVKRVLTTANILNALRKKNKELKRKIEEAKKQERAEAQVEKEDKVLEEGSIEQYQTLQANSKFVDPVTEPAEEEGVQKTVDEETVTREMKKDAKLLLKMYRKLLNSKKIKRKEKKKKRKQKKQAGEAEAFQSNGSM